MTEINKKLWMSAKELLDSEIKKPEWLVENLIAEGGIVLFGGEPASFKSYLALIIAVFGANEMKILDTFKTKKFRTLIIDEENRLPRIKERLIKIIKGEEIENENMEIYFIANQGFKFDYMYSGQKKQIEKVLNEIKPDLVILDSMVRMMLGDENSSKDVRRIFDNIKSLNLIHNCAWLLLHHTRKTLGNSSKIGLDLRGSGDFMAMADEVIMLNRKNKNEFVLSKHKCRDGDEINSIGFVVFNNPEGGICIDNVFEEQEEAKLPIEVNIENIVNWIEREKITEFRTKQIRDILKDIPYQSLTNALNEMVKGTHKKLKRIVKGKYQVIQT